MKKIAAAMAVLLCTVTAASGAPTNLLIGTWKLDPAITASPYCLGPTQFTAAAVTQRDLQGKLSTIPVTYIAGQTTTFPTVVYLVEGIDHATYVFSSPNAMVLDTYLQCKYVRE